MKKISLLLAIAVVFSLVLPYRVRALTMTEILSVSPISPQTSAEAKAFIVLDKLNHNVMLAKNQDMLWPPASLTKLVTAMVFLESKTPLDKIVAMKKEDEVGGSRLYTKTGIQYKARDLLHSAIIASNNNAANALARATGLTRSQFVAKMNKKAQSLGAGNTNFIDPTGINPKSYTTAEDFAKIVEAAFSDDYLSLIARKENYKFTSVNNKAYTHNIKTTNKLLQDGDVAIIGGKTGYLTESLYNFAAIAKDRLRNEFVVVVLGAGNPTQQFFQTKQLALQATAMKAFGIGPMVAGTSTPGSNK